MKWNIQYKHDVIAFLIDLACLNKVTLSSLHFYVRGPQTKNKSLDTPDVNTKEAKTSSMVGYTFADTNGHFGVLFIAMR